MLVHVGQFVLPAVASLALGAALLVPLRDDRLGKRATIGGKLTPFRMDFRELCRQADDGAERARIRFDHHEFRKTLLALASRLRTFFTAGEDTPKHDPITTVAESEDRRELLIERSFAATLDVLMAPSEPAGDAGIAPVSIAALGPAHFREHTRDRVVPLTRLPLRPQTPGVAWTQTHALAETAPTRAERLNCLRTAASDGTIVNDAALLAAYHEEDAEGRILVLHALRRRRVRDARECFVDAMRAGTDEERRLAVEALVGLGDRDAVIAAFTDRVEAVAACAALGYVASARREDYLRELAPYVDRARIDVLLALLAGAVE